MASIKMEELTFPSECQIEPYLVNLLHRMLDKNPKTRITLEEAMNHEWVTKEGVCPTQSGGEIEVPGRDRRHSEAQRGIMHVARSRGEDKQQRAVDAAASKGASAAGGASDENRTHMPIRNSIGIGGASTAEDTVSTTTQHSLPEETEGRQDRGDKKIASSPLTLALSLSMSRSRSYRASSLSMPEAPVGEGNEPQRKRHQQQQQQRRRRQPKQELIMQEGGRGEKPERGHHRRFGQDAAVAAAKRKTSMNEEEVEEKEDDEETSTWSDGDDKVPSPRILEDIVDNW